MKRITLVLAIGFILIVTISIFTKPIILSLAKAQIENVFIDSRVSIGTCSLEPMGLLKFCDVKIKKEPMYDLNIKEALIYFTIGSLLKKTIPKIYIDGISIDVDMPQKSLLEFKNFLNLKPKRKDKISLDSLKVSSLSLRLKTKEFIIDADMSLLDLGLREPLLKSFNLRINSLETKGFRLEGASMKFAKGGSLGDLYIKEIEYNKVKAEDIKSKIKIEDNTLSLSSLSAKFFGGILEGNLNLAIEKNIEYILSLNVLNLDLGTLVKDLNMLEKFQISGRLRGDVGLRGKGSDIDFLKGYLSATEPGGTLTIKDKRFLKTIAKNTKQSLDVLVKGFEDYHYTTGSIRLSLEGNNLILDIALDGEAGKRNLTITVHDFKLKREGLWL